MRLLILSNLYPPNVVGGYERLCFAVASALAARGYAVTVLTSSFGRETASYPGQVVLREWRLLTGEEIYAPFSGTAAERERVNQDNLAILQRTLAQVRPDAVFAWNLFFLDASILDALQGSGVPCSVMLTDNWLLVMRNPAFVAGYFRDGVHGTGRHTPPLPAWRRWANGLRHLAGRSTGASLAAVFGSAYMRDLYHAGGARFAREKVIHNGVRLLRTAGEPVPDRRRLLEPGVLRLLFAGRLVDLKGAHLAVAALAMLDPAALGVGRVQLTIVGDAADEPYRRSLQAQIEASACRDSIHLQHPVPEAALPGLFDAHDVYLFPSLYEPFALTLIHALACAIPTVASRAGGNGELIRDGREGLLFEKGDAAGLARQVARLATDGDLRVRLALAGQARAQHFSFDRMVDEMARFLASPRNPFGTAA